MIHLAKVEGRRLAIVGAWVLMASCDAGRGARDVIVRVIDEETGRGVPLVELTLLNEVKYWTDSAGVAVLDEPSLLGGPVFVTVRSHGYEDPGETYLGSGASRSFDAGSIEEISIRRTMVAERLYRLTGEGIYRDSIRAGLPVPIDEPALNGQVLGQDTASTAIYRGELFWIWGDTVGPSYFNGSVSAATSSLRDDPALGIDFDYFEDAEGRAKPMLPLEGGGLVWIEGLLPLVDDSGDERLAATYTRQDGLTFPEECGVALFDDAKQVFERWFERPCMGSHRSSHPVLHEGYWYLYPGLRVPNDWGAVQAPDQWQSREVIYPPNLDGIVLNRRISAIAWNEYRQRFIALLENFGAVYYAEADAPEGPYGEAVRIIEHDQYNFYNVLLHPYFDQDGGRVVFIEGTYTDAFTNAPMKTPRYNYNQIMFRLALDDPRLAPAQQ